ncbi:hypothetical protein B7494_g8431 [Chlorociboria aeruginascens]|nr:hypothetical protein B7494_g8431 [Chlorociboria aeruginascens]
MPSDYSPSPPRISPPHSPPEWYYNRSQSWSPPPSYGSLSLSPIDPNLEILGHDDIYGAGNTLSAAQQVEQLPSVNETRPEPDEDFFDNSPPFHLFTRRESPSLFDPPSLDPFDPFNEYLDFPFPPTPRHISPSSSVVDLTSSPEQNKNMAGSNRKRKATDSGAGRAAKTARASASASGSGHVPRSSRSTRASSRATPSAKRETADVVDLVHVEDDSQYDEFKVKQQAELIKQQQQDEADKPRKLAEFQCIICLDNPTDLTVTHCGHLFCSECLHNALYAGNNAKKQCPICRTTVNNLKINGKPPKNGVFPMEMKLMTANKKGKQRVR